MRLWVALALLAFAFLLVVPLAAYVLMSTLGEHAAMGAVVAGGVCWLAGSLALLVTALYSKLGNPLAAVAGAMLFRMGFPLGVLIWAAKTAPWLMEADFALICVGFYFYMLIVETTLSLRVSAVNVEKTKAVEV